jgi:predicted alpha/beta-hydrolase family hydrolase
VAKQKGQKGLRGLVLFPGAGADRNQPSLVALEEGLGDLLVITRVDFPYRLAGRRAPDRPPVLLAAVQEAARSFAKELGVGPEQLLLGGRSMGGRIASMTAIELGVGGLVLISYPLHPPGKPQTLRTEHFSDLALPCLFVSGTKDTFGTPDELTAATAQIPGPVTHDWIEGGDHGLRRKDDQVVAAVRQWVLTQQAG